MPDVAVSLDRAATAKVQQAETALKLARLTAERRDLWNDRPLSGKQPDDLELDGGTFMLIGIRQPKAADAK